MTPEITSVQEIIECCRRLSPEERDAIAEALIGFRAELPPLANQLASLTAREREVMDLLVEGAQTKAIALRLDISPKAVDKHRCKVLHKLRVESQVALVRAVRG